MSPGFYLAKFVSLPELRLKNVNGRRPGWFECRFESRSKERACPHCATLSGAIYDHRWVKILDAPLRDRRVRMLIHKKRYYCSRCERPFTELLSGIFKGARLSERLRRHLLWCCERMQNLLQVARAVGCSPSTVRRSWLAHLELHFRRHLLYDWPSAVGLDEHYFGHSRGPPGYKTLNFDTTAVDLRAHRLYRVVEGREQKMVFNQLKDIPGGDRVADVTIDMSDGYFNVATALFPNARITIDKFHVLRLPTKALNNRRVKLTGDKRRNPIGRLLLCSRHELDYSLRSKIDRFLAPHFELRKVYEFKERLQNLYRIRGRKRAEAAMSNLLSDLESLGDQIPELKTLAFTLTHWRHEILNYFDSGLTNAMTEGFNNKIKLIKRMAYGYRNQNFYFLRLLKACYH